MKALRARLRELDPVMVAAAVVLAAIGGSVLLLAVLVATETVGHSR